ncbi:hypothetical protein Taro_025021, partial [Colocasia esculenta]|nr:hypothetical protein [Colocasia esculenta]
LVLPPQRTPPAGLPVAATAAWYNHRSTALSPSAATPPRSFVAPFASTIIGPAAITVAVLFIPFPFVYILTHTCNRSSPRPLRSDARLTPSANMYGFSIADGFLDVSQGVEEMIKYLANEPSVGLFFVQQHAQNAMPNVLNLKVKIVEKTNEMILHTEDSEDSICAIRSMTECGLPIVDGMIKDINKLLHVMSTSQPRKGSLRRSSWSFQRGSSSSQASTSFGDLAFYSHEEEGSSRGYLSTVFNSVKQKATTLRWPQIDPLPERSAVSSASSPLLAPSTVTAAMDLDIEVDGLPLSSQTIDVQLDEGGTTTEDASSHDLVSTIDNYEKFKSEREVKLEEWLEDFEERCKPAETNL